LTGNWTSWFFQIGYFGSNDLGYDFEKLTLFIFFIGLFQSHDLGREFDRISWVGSTLISMVTSLSWAIVYVFFIPFQHLNIIFYTQKSSTPRWSTNTKDSFFLFEILFKTQKRKIIFSFFVKIIIYYFVWGVFYIFIWMFFFWNFQFFLYYVKYI